MRFGEVMTPEAILELYTYRRYLVWLQDEWPKLKEDMERRQGKGSVVDRDGATGEVGDG